jgi:hypothetical protein
MTQKAKPVSDAERKQIKSQIARLSAKLGRGVKRRQPRLSERERQRRAKQMRANMRKRWAKHNKGSADE